VASRKTLSRFVQGTGQRGEMSQHRSPIRSGSGEGHGVPNNRHVINFHFAVVFFIFCIACRQPQEGERRNISHITLPCGYHQVVVHADCLRRTCYGPRSWVM